MEDKLAIVPLRRALRVRQPAAGFIVHSDREGQYVSKDLNELVSLWRIRLSMIGPTSGRADDPYDNAFADGAARAVVLDGYRPCGWLMAEMLEGGAFLDLEDGKVEIFDRAAWAVRKHSSLSYKSLEQFEMLYHEKLASKVCH